MNKIIDLKLEEENKITLTKEITKVLGLEIGDSITISCEKSVLGDACFTVESRKEDISDEGYYCIPLRIFKKVDLDEENLHLIVNDEEITLTSAMNVVSAIHPELIEAMIAQGVDFNILVEDIVERLNENVLERNKD